MLLFLLANPLVNVRIRIIIFKSKLLDLLFTIIIRIHTFTNGSVCVCVCLLQVGEQHARPPRVLSWAHSLSILIFITRWSNTQWMWLTVHELIIIQYDLFTYCIVFFLDVEWAGGRKHPNGGTLVQGVGPAVDPGGKVPLRTERRAQAVRHSLVASLPAPPPRSVSLDCWIICCFYLCVPLCVSMQLWLSPPRARLQPAVIVCFSEV